MARLPTGSNGTSLLVLAAAALDDELRALDDLAQKAKAGNLQSDKGLARVTRTLADSVDLRVRIEEKLRGLVAEIESARLRQQDSVKILVDIAHELGKRSTERDALVVRFGELGAWAGRVNVLAADLSARRAEGATDQEVLDRLREIHTEMDGVVSAARTLAEEAETEGWTEIARHADAVRQQIQAAKNNLAAAARNVAARAPS